MTVDLNPIQDVPTVRRSLHDLIAHDGVLSHAECARVLEQILGWLETVHNQVHRHGALSMALVMMGEGLEVEDLGEPLPQDARGGGQRCLVMMAAAPEQLIEGGVVGAHSDLYAVGLMGYQCLMGAHPYGPECRDFSNPATIIVSRTLDEELVRLPEEHGQTTLGRVIHRLLEKDILARYASCADVLADLRGGA